MIWRPISILRTSTYWKSLTYKFTFILVGPLFSSDNDDDLGRVKGYKRAEAWRAKKWADIIEKNHTFTRPGVRIIVWWVKKFFDDLPFCLCPDDYNQDIMIWPQPQRNNVSPKFQTYQVIFRPDMSSISVSTIILKDKIILRGAIHPNEAAYAAL